MPPHGPLSYFKIFGGEKDKVGKNRGGDRGRENGGRGIGGADVLHLLGKVRPPGAVHTSAIQKWPSLVLLLF